MSLQLLPLRDKVARPPTYAFKQSTCSPVFGSYDAAGNQLVVNGDTLTYDADNHMASAYDNVTHNTEYYFYDGMGRRIVKGGPAGRTAYVYDAFGQLAAEYSTVPQDPLCTTCYLSYDLRGDVRMVTDQSGNVVARHDYLPFGTEVPANTAGRGSQWGLTNNVEQKFTGQIRDTETSMDYFHARYYGSAFGRFTSPDPKSTGADPTDPQSWNAYAYVGNNPLTLTDPDGLSFWGSVGKWFLSVFGCNALVCVTVTDNAPVGTYAWWMNGGWRTVNGRGNGSRGGGPLGEPTSQPLAPAQSQSPAPPATQSSAPPPTQRNPTPGTNPPPTTSTPTPSTTAKHPNKPITCTAAQQAAARLAESFESAAESSGWIALGSGVATAVSGAGEGITFGTDTPVTITFGSITGFFGTASVITEGAGAALNSFANGNLTALHNFGWSQLSNLAAKGAASRIPIVEPWSDTIGDLAERASDLTNSAQEVCR